MKRLMIALILLPATLSAMMGTGQSGKGKPLSMNAG